MTEDRSKIMDGILTRQILESDEYKAVKWFLWAFSRKGCNEIDVVLPEDVLRAIVHKFLNNGTVMYRYSCNIIKGEVSSYWVKNHLWEHLLDVSNSYRFDLSYNRFYVLLMYRLTRRLAFQKCNKYRCILNTFDAAFNNEDENYGTLFAILIDIDKISLDDWKYEHPRCLEIIEKLYYRRWFSLIRDIFEFVIPNGIIPNLSRAAKILLSTRFPDIAFDVDPVEMQKYKDGMEILRKDKRYLPEDDMMDGMREYIDPSPGEMAVFIRELYSLGGEVRIFHAMGFYEVYRRYIRYGTTERYALTKGYILDD